ncbi:MAG: hypothetical protein L0H59_09325 [Tomitella sp.]|nr:hypothetical protein [Tomitella sp.]
MTNYVSVDPGVFTAAILAAALLALPPPPARARVRSWRPPVYGTRARHAVPICAAVAIGVACVLWGWAAAVAIAIAAITVDHLHTRRLRARGAAGQSAALVGALEIVVAELKVGAHPGLACATAAAQTSAGPVSRRLATAAAQAQLGGTVSRALVVDGAPGTRAASGWESAGAARRDSEAWGRIAAVWSVAERRGIALAGLLDVARRDLVVRASFRRRADAGLSGARSTAVVLAALPIVGIGFGHLMGAAPLQVLTGGGIGGMLLVGGVLLDCAGLVWAESIAAGAAQ